MEEINRLMPQLDDETMELNTCSEWLQAMDHSEHMYLAMLSNGQTPQQARAVLPNSLKTEIVVSTNFREWRHIFKLRAVSKAAHPQMRDLMIPLYEYCRGKVPEIFDLGDPQ
jgi:thymidylate synthase (FAD)